MACHRGIRLRFGYWSNCTSAGAIRAGDLGGGGPITLFNGEGVAIDAAAGKIYWADTPPRVIRAANLDGTGARDLYTGERLPSGVAIVPPAGFCLLAGVPIAGVTNSSCS